MIIPAMAAPLRPFFGFASGVAASVGPAFEVGFTSVNTIANINAGHNKQTNHDSMTKTKWYDFEIKSEDKHDMKSNSS